MGFGVKGLGFGVKGSGFGVIESGFGVRGSGSEFSRSKIDNHAVQDCVQPCASHFWLGQLEEAPGLHVSPSRSRGARIVYPMCQPILVWETRLPASPGSQVPQLGASGIRVRGFGRFWDQGSRFRALLGSGFEVSGASGRKTQKIRFSRFSACWALSKTIAFLFNFFLYFCDFGADLVREHLRSLLGFGFEVLRASGIRVRRFGRFWDQSSRF